MSFSHNVKEELCSLITDRNKEYACLYGMLLFGKGFDGENIVFQTEHKPAADMFRRLADKFSGKTGCADVSESPRKNGAVLYTLTVADSKARENIVFRFKGSTDNSGNNRHICMDIIDNSNIFAFLDGAFLSCGSVTEPLKDYHLEFAVPFEELCSELRSMICGMGINAKYIVRKGIHVIYMKGSEDIEDMLTIMGATKSSIELMNVKILKDVRNKANRIANCDSANIERTLAAAQRQIDDIEFIIKQKGIDFLPPDLRSIALVRLENPDVSLKELGEMLDKPVGRSGANHRLKRITAIAEELRK